MSEIVTHHDRFRLDGRVAVITGASSGIGAHFARVLHDAGATVAAVARRADRLDEVCGPLERGHAFVADLADPSARERVIGEILDKLGPIDILVNNAGFSDGQPIEEETLERFERVLNLNLTAVWHLTKLAGVSMVDQGRGSVINIGSMLGFVGSAPIKTASYTASKGALVNITREIALQWATTGVRVNSIAPGWFRTEMTTDLEDDSSQAFVMRNTPMRRMGDVEELSGPLLLLASDAGSFMTGTTIVVDGGWLAR